MTSRREDAGIVHRIDLNAETHRWAADLAGSWRVGQGESETLALGREVGRAILDDGRATRVAEAIGVEPLSTLFLPVLGAMAGMSHADAIAFLRSLAIVANARAETCKRSSKTAAPGGRVVIIENGST